MDKIEENKIICHIVGLNPNQKLELKNYISKDNNFNLIDLDSLNDEILNDDEMQNMFKSFSKYKKSKNDKYKEIDKKMNKFWEDSLIKKVVNSLPTKKKSILVGKNHHYRILSKRINFLVSCKFIIDSNLKEEVKMTIKSNLEEYKNDIINGVFPLQFLDFKSQIKKRISYQDSYLKSGYQKYKFKNILDIIDATSKNKIKGKGLWYTSKESYNVGSEIHPENNMIIAFSDPVLSLLNSFNINEEEIELNSEEDKVVSIKNLDAKRMKGTRNLYFISKENFIPLDLKKFYKYFTQNSVLIIDKEKINNVYNKLVELNIMN